MDQPIAGFLQDDAGDWVARLACGHTQHVRHRPPWESRPWVTTEEGRAAQVGTTLACPACDMGAFPPDVVAYRRTDAFTEATVPAALLRDHTTKAGVWARIVVEEGKLEYTCPRGVFFLKPGTDGVVEPTVPHHVRPLGPVRFFVEFRRAQAPG